MALKNNTWKLNQWYDQSVAGNISYSGSPELWAWGNNEYGDLGQNNRTNYSSPTQIPGTTWTNIAGGGGGSCAFAINSSGELYAWGRNTQGQLGQNQGPGQLEHSSSPVQIPGTTWSRLTAGNQGVHAVKTDGTLWSWAMASDGSTGLNANTRYSSPTQVPGTTWSQVSTGTNTSYAIKTDGTAWSWGTGDNGKLGHNNQTKYSSPVQLGSDTTWSKTFGAQNQGFFLKDIPLV